MNRLFLACGLVALVAVACGGEVEQGDPGAQGPQGETGAPGSTGSAGDPGTPGSTGATGSEGSAGSAGAQGDQGEVGDQGQTGDIACGDSLIPAAEWHTACGSSVGACHQGQVQCRLSNVEGELVPYRTCYGEQAPVANSGKCNLDTDCDGALDNTTGTGDNVTLVKQSKQVEILVSGSSSNHDFTLVEGKCRNAKKHCLLPSNDVCLSQGNGVGVLWGDFVADPKEGDMGYECVSGADVRTWECTVTGGVASVTCTGPRGL